MKSLLVFVAFSIVAINAIPTQSYIDWSNVVPITELPGFWDGRDVQLTSILNQQTKNRRIVGG